MDLHPGPEKDHVVEVKLSELAPIRRALQENEDWCQDLVEHSQDLLCIHDLEGRLLSVNPAPARILGYSVEEILQIPIRELVPPEFREQFDVYLNQIERFGEAKGLMAVMTRSGERRIWEYHNTLRREGVATAIVLGLARDVTEQKRAEKQACEASEAIVEDIAERRRAEEARRRSEESYRMFISQSSEGIFQDDLDPPVPIDLPEDELIHRFLHDTVMVECNDAMAAMYGFGSGEELRGLHMSERVVSEDPRNIELAREFIRSGFRLIERESHEVDRCGNPRVFLNSMIGTVESGKLVRVWGIQRDITEKVKLEESRRKAEEALRENVAQLREVTEELRLAKEKLSEEKLYLEQAIDTELGFGEIIGRSSALKEVMQKVAKVAPSDAAVLLLGETGTGKELVARAIHRMSHREGNSFIKLNCAAIPSGLLESELFGHEKGAFTGAVARKLGRLELADRGTLFLDEVGEIPLSLQPKLLRVLQDMEFERLGGTQTLKVNFRLLAATNRDLLQSVKAREFRSDLYYRLNVFPILIPPLRERREDIRPLIEHFVRKFATQMKKSITSIPSKTMEMLVRWNWPGNIRELENFVERSVILTPGPVLQAPLSELHTAVDQGNGGASAAFRDKERERILRALRDCRGRLGGPDGAAARLGLERTTLQSKLDRLGIKPGSFRA
jgi:PAS domain S-box-containing protein